MNSGIALPSIAATRNIAPMTGRQAMPLSQTPRGIDDASVRADKLTASIARAPASKMEAVPR